MSQTQTGDVYCPHLDKYDEKELKRLFSKVAAVRAEDPDLFDFTHRPISVYPSEEAGEEDAREVSESEVLEKFNETQLRNYAVIIEGEVGTGKSELCAYLVHRLREQDRPILRVDKDDDLMSILTERLPEFYREHFGKELPEKDTFEQLKSDIKEVPRVVAGYAANGAVLEFTKKDFDVSIPEEDERKILEIIVDRLEKLVNRGEYGNQMNIISEEQYESKSCLDVFNEPISKEDAVEQWNDALWSQIQDNYDTKSLSEMLKLVGSEFEGERPIAVFEDFGIASVEAKKLRNYIERDKDEDNWDFIIAGTSDTISVLHKQTAESRFAFYRTNKPDTNNVTFLDEDSAVDFIRPYLSYIKTGDGSVRYQDDVLEGNLLKPQEGSMCDECDLCTDEFRELFPFNKSFIRRIYTGLNTDLQSPREFVMKLFDILLDYYNGVVDSPSSSGEIDEDVNNNQLSSPDDSVYDKMEEFADLASWYGTEENGYYVVPRQFPEAFGMIDETTTETTLKADIKVDSESVKIPLSGFREKIEDDEDDEDDGGKPTQTTEKKPKSKVDKIYGNRQGDVNNWIDAPLNDNFTETNSYIETALEDLIEYVTQDYTLWSDSSLEYSISSQKTPFRYINSVDAEPPEDFQFGIDTYEFRRSEIRDLLRHGIKLDEESNKDDREYLLEKLGTQITEYGQKWRRRIINNYILNQNNLYTRGSRHDYDFNDFLLASYAWLVLLDDPWSTLNTERINEAYASNEDLEIDSELASALKGRMDDIEYSEIEEVFEHSSSIEELVGSRMGIRSSALDVRKIRSILDSNPPEKVLSSLAKTNINDLHHKVRFSTNETLEDVALSVYESFNGTDDVFDGYEPAEIADSARNLFDGVKMKKVSEIVDALDTYDQVDPKFQEAVNKFVRLNQSDLDDIVSATRMIVEVTSNRWGESDSSLTKEQANLAGLKVEGSQPVDRYEEMQNNWSSPSAGEASKFLEVSEFYVE